jgi:phospho-N-acetylmuramoyl-pentapeptide-transferase
MHDIVLRPDVSLGATLTYSFLAFLIGLLFTPAFYDFLIHFKLGKQLRTEAVDGRDASVFLSLHKGKTGTPTMGGVLIWGSIFTTVAISRILSLFGQVDHSLLQRGQVYIPLGMLLGLGVLGALDDYLGTLSLDRQKIRASLPTIKTVLSGGLLLIVASFSVLYVQPLSFSVLLWNPLSYTVMLCALFFITCLFNIGGDDVNNALDKILIGEGKKAGLNALPKMFFLIMLSLETALWFYARLGYHTLHVPFGNIVGLPEFLDLGLWYIPFFMFIFIGTANAVNVTDGLDGLAGGLLILAFGAFGVVAYTEGFTVLAAFCGVVVGAIAAFLWHNIPPALFFMGDTGAMALGGTLAVMAFMIDEVLLLPLVGFIFVMEMLSVIVQLTSKRLRGGKKIFRSAPVHHHFEALGWGESKVTMRFWIIGAFMAFLGVLVGMYS